MLNGDTVTVEIKKLERGRLEAVTDGMGTDGIGTVIIISWTTRPRTCVFLAPQCVQLRHCTALYPHSPIISLDATESVTLNALIRYVRNSCASSWSPWLNKPVLA